MKKTIYFFLALMLTTAAMQAQVSVNVTTKAPSWGPVGHNNATYYYLPDVETYYDLSKRQYVYLNDGKWVRNASLPVQYRSYNLYNGYKVVFTNPAPYKYHSVNKVKYKKGYKGKPQKNIGSNGRGNGKVGHPGYKGPKGHGGNGQGGNGHSKGHKNKDK